MSAWPARYVVWVFSGFLFLWPIALGWGLWHGWRRSLPLWCLAVTALPMTMLACLQLKFSDLFSVPYALVLSAATIGGAIPGSRHRLVRLGMGLIVTVLLWPSVREVNYSRPFVVLDGDYFINVYPALDWLRQNTPPPTDEGTGAGDYAVLANWDMGHWIISFSRRPVVTSPLGHTARQRQGIREGAAMFARPPEEALPSMARRRVRYLLVTPLSLDATFTIADWNPATGKPEREKPSQRDMAESLYARLLMFDAGGFPDAARDAMRHVRLVHEEDRMIQYPRFQRPRPAAMVFEIVPGAVLCGTTRPEAVVTVSGKVKTGTGREFAYRDETRADAAGRFTIVVPYATGKPEFSDTTLADGYAVEAAGASGRARPSEAEVRSGASVAVAWNGSPEN